MDCSKRCTHNITHINIIFFIGAIQQVRHLGRRVDNESNKNDIRRRVYSQKSDAPHTNCSVYFFL